MLTYINITVKRIQTLLCADMNTYLSGDNINAS